MGILKSKYYFPGTKESINLAPVLPSTTAKPVWTVHRINNRIMFVVVIGRTNARTPVRMDKRRKPTLSLIFNCSAGGLSFLNLNCPSLMPETAPMTTVSGKNRRLNLMTVMI